MLATHKNGRPGRPSMNKFPMGIDRFVQPYGDYGQLLASCVRMFANKDNELTQLGFRQPIGFLSI